MKKRPDRTYATTPTMVQRAFFVVLLFLVTLTFLWLIRGFLQPIFWAVALAIVVYPLHTSMKQRFPERASIAAATSVLLVVLIVILPLAGIITAVGTEATALVQRIDDGGFDLNEFYVSIERYLPPLRSVLETLRLDQERLEAQLSSATVEVSRIIAARALTIGQSTLRIAVFFFLMLYLLFFFLRDGSQILDWLIRALPLGDERERLLLERFAEVSRATIKGTLVVGIAQGTIGGLAFMMLGLAAPVLWGVVMALLSIVPAVGPAIVWIPAAILLVVSGRIVAAIVLVLIGTLVIGLVDNLLRPILVGRDTRMPDYMILLATLGGITAFGLAGIVIGPIIAAFFLTCWEMSASDFNYDNHRSLSSIRLSSDQNPDEEAGGEHAVEADQPAAGTSSTPAHAPASERQYAGITPGDLDNGRSADPPGGAKKL